MYCKFFCKYLALYTAEYQNKRKHVKKLIKRAHATYIKRIEENLVCEPRRFWIYINRKRGAKGETSSLSYKSKPRNSPKSAAMAFADHFSSVFSGMSNYSLIQPNSQSVPCFTYGREIEIREIHQNEVSRAIQKLKPKRSSGPDGIPPYIFKGCKEYIIQPLHYIFNLSLKTGTFPQAWKLSKITPLSKTAEITEISNYRPIAQLSVPAKIFETVIHQQIYQQVKHLIANRQHGFMEGRSVSTNLATYIHDVSGLLQENGQVDAIYTDFQKAFDKVNHDLLLMKMENMGFSRKLLTFFKSYLMDRQQYVEYRGGNQILSNVHQESRRAQIWVRCSFSSLLMI